MPEINGIPSTSTYSGSLQVNVTSAGLLPISGAQITITYNGKPDYVIESLTTDASGQTDVVDLPAPPLDFSMEPTATQQPYSEYNISVRAPGFEPILVSGVQVLPDVRALQPITMNQQTEGQGEAIVIDPHTLFGDYPLKIPEMEIKPMEETGETILSQVTIPEYVVVHDGSPADQRAQNYYVKYRDYIKNVASSVLYATWPENTIYANILAIMSFTLNRVYTEWYRNKGFEFTITNSPAFDQKYIYGRNIFSNISTLVDSIFANYISRPGMKQPLFTSYCGGQRTTCAGLSQWGSRDLGEQGYSALEILRYYYGNDVYINTAEQIAGVPVSWPGYALTAGSAGGSVRIIQEQLNRISQAYPAIPKVAVDGVFEPRTEETVKTFQRIFGMPQTGVVDYAAWHKIAFIYVAVTRMAVLE